MIRSPLKRSAQRRFVVLGLLAAAGTAAGLHFGLNATWPTAAIIAINVATFVLYAYDKAAAGSNAGRVPEVVLHAAALVGGSPAALIAQRTLRHKTVKRPFQITFWTIVAIQAAAAAWYVTRPR